MLCVHDGMHQVTWRKTNTVTPHQWHSAEKWWVIKRPFETFYYFLVAVFQPKHACNTALLPWHILFARHQPHHLFSIRNINQTRSIIRVTWLCGLESAVRFWTGGRKLLPLQYVHIGSAPPATYSRTTKTFTPGKTRSACEVNLSRPSSSEVLYVRNLSSWCAQRQVYFLNPLSHKGRQIWHSEHWM